MSPFHYFGILAGLGFVFYGTRSLSFALQNLSGDRFYRHFGEKEMTPLKAFFTGILGTLCSGNSNVTTLSITTLVNAGLVKPAPGIAIINGSFLGAVILIGLIALLPAHFGFAFVALGMVISLFFKKSIPLHSGRILFGLGMVLLGRDYFFVNANNLLAHSAEVTSFLASTDIALMASAAVFGVTLAALFDSSLVVSLLALELNRRGLFSEGGALIVVFASLFGMGVKAIFYTRDKSIFARRMSFVMAVMGVFFLTASLIYVGLWPLPPGGKFLIILEIFSLCTAAVLMFFVGPLNRLSIIQIPDDPINEQYKLTLVGKASDMVPVTALQESYLQVMKQFDVVGRLFRLSREFLESPEELGPRKLAKIKDYERIIDNITDEVHLYLKHLMQKPLASGHASLCFSLLKISKELEAVADFLDRSSTSAAMASNRQLMKGETGAELLRYWDQVSELFFAIEQGLRGDGGPAHEAMKKRGEELRQRAKNLMAGALKNHQHEEIGVESWLFYQEQVSFARSIRSHLREMMLAMDEMGGTVRQKILNPNAASDSALTKSSWVR